MFKLVKTPKTGHCAAMRCAATEDLTDKWFDGKEIELCARHVQEVPVSPSVPPDPNAADLGLGDSGVMTVAVSPGLVQGGIANVAVQAAEQIGELEGLEIETEDQSSAVQLFLTSVVAGRKAHEAERLSVVKPMGDMVRTINSWFKPGTDAVLKLEAKLKGALATYTKGLAAERLQLLHEGKHDEALAVSDGAINDNIQVRERWTFTIDDAAQIPLDYWIVDERKIQAVVTAQKGGCCIPGIRVYDAGSVAVRTS